MELQKELERAQNERKANKRFLGKLKRRPPKNLDATVAELHDEVFEAIDCLSCANCCRTTSPIVRDVDIDRLARHLRIRPAELVEKYMLLDTEGDYVMNSAPCPFLGADNYCSVYAARPKACREYPHTDRKNFHQILSLTFKNTLICPAALKVVERLRGIGN
ncbi:zinc/iron-chelating domain-containing protein [Lewinellaceae bacterium SD302]|nr:zinc/iron-chelating domain-containing protein [Lewinellaceae bacterium SD302]